ncbi:MAG: hypothetical protein PHF79_00260 [Candidatus Pacebacteria bacterium]|nr:hypothetical protein [Candidatus Paceibacterota bacterium]
MANKDTSSISPRFWLVFLVAFLPIIFGGYLVWMEWPQAHLRVSFFNLGTAKNKNMLVLIEAPNGVRVLINAGDEDRAALSILGRSLPIYQYKIDAVILTEMKRKYIGGFPSVAERYDVGKVLAPFLNVNTASVSEASSTSDQRAIEAVMSSLSEKKLEAKIALQGMKIVLDQKRDIYLEILFPDRIFSSARREMREGIIVSRLVYGKTVFTFSDGVSQSIRDYLKLPADEWRASSSSVERFESDGEKMWRIN